MRKFMLLVVLLVLAVASLTTAMPASAGEIKETGISFLATMREGKVTTVWKVRITGLRGRSCREIPFRNDIGYPYWDEPITIQVMTPNGKAEHKGIQFGWSLCGHPGEGSYQMMVEDNYGWSADIGCISPDPTGRGRATNLQIFAFVKDGSRKEIRLAGIKEPITNLLLKLTGRDSANIEQYDVLGLVPQDPAQAQVCQNAVPATTRTIVADPETVNRNFGEVAKKDECQDQNIQTLNGGLTELRGESKGMRADLDVVMGWMNRCTQAQPSAAAVAQATTSTTMSSKVITIRNVGECTVVRKFWFRSATSWRCCSKVVLNLAPGQSVSWPVTVGYPWVGWDLFDSGYNPNGWRNDKGEIEGAVTNYRYNFTNTTLVEVR